MERRISYLQVGGKFVEKVTLGNETRNDGSLAQLTIIIIHPRFRSNQLRHQTSFGLINNLSCKNTDCVCMTRSKTFPTRKFSLPRLRHDLGTRMN